MYTIRNRRRRTDINSRCGEGSSDAGRLVTRARGRVCKTKNGYDYRSLPRLRRQNSAIHHRFRLIEITSVSNVRVYRFGVVSYPHRPRYRISIFETVITYRRKSGTNNDRYIYIYRHTCIYRYVRERTF